MKKIFIFLFLISQLIYSQETIYHSPHSDYENGKTYYLFGGNVAFRTEPNRASKIIDILKIGSEIQVLEKTDVSFQYDWFNSNYYKVKYNDSIGYLYGGYISLERKEIGKSKYFFTYAYSDKTEKYYLVIRCLNEDSEIPYEEVAELNTNDISIEVFDNKGVEGVENIIFINYLSEACGVDGGGIYIFKFNDMMKKVFWITQISDAGVYWINEKLIFPNDENGINGKIVYKKEVGSYKDEDTNWIEISNESRELEWINGEILPKFETKN